MFTFPIVFQSLHIVWHHSNEEADSYINTECQSYHYQGFQEESVDTSSESIHCLVCAYKFPKNNIQHVSVFYVVIPLVGKLFRETLVIQPVEQIIALKSPRAPPHQMFL